jgi:hypothetical protein
LEEWFRRLNFLSIAKGQLQVRRCSFGTHAEDFIRTEPNLEDTRLERTIRLVLQALQRQLLAVILVSMTPSGRGDAFDEARRGPRVGIELDGELKVGDPVANGEGFPPRPRLDGAVTQLAAERESPTAEVDENLSRAVVLRHLDR